MKKTLLFIGLMAIIGGAFFWFSRAIPINPKDSSFLKPPDGMPEAGWIEYVDDGIPCDKATNLKLFRDETRGYEFKYPCSLHRRLPAGVTASEDFIYLWFVESPFKDNDNIFFSLEAPPRQVDSPPYEIIASEEFSVPQSNFSLVKRTLDYGYSEAIILEWSRGSERGSGNLGLGYTEENKNKSRIDVFLRVINSFRFLSTD